MQEISFVIQAGGQSTRMGEDKGLMDFGGETIVEFILKQVVDYGQEILVISNRPEAYRFLNHPIFMDVFPGIGALGGLYTALNYASNDSILILACDMPFVNQTLIEYMISVKKDNEVVVPVLGEKKVAEPFRALYSKRAISAIEYVISQGKRRAISFYDSVKVKELSQDEIDSLDPDGRSFINLNTPADYQKALQLINN